MFTSLAALVAPVVIGVFLPTTDLKIESQKDYVKIDCSSEICTEKKAWIDQGYACDSSSDQSWCSKDVIGIVAPDTLKTLMSIVATPWQGYQLKLYQPRKTPELTFNSSFSKQWQVDQKVWLSNPDKNIDRVTYNSVLLQNGDEVKVSFYFGNTDDDSFNLSLDPQTQDLWREKTVQMGAPTHYLKSTVQLRWQKQLEAL